MDQTLVTGATGLVGFAIVSALLKRHRPVKALVRSVRSAKALLPPEVELVEGDISDGRSTSIAMEDCSVVYHAAGIPEQWLKDRNAFERVNVQGTLNAIRAALRKRVQCFVYISTVDVFAAGKGERFDETMIDPHLKPTDYERSKQKADRLVAAAIEDGLSAIVIHPSAVYGPGPTNSRSLNFLMKQIARRKVPMVPPGKLPVVLSDDVADGCIEAEKIRAVGERYILSESCVELSEFSRIVAEELGFTTFPRVMPFWLATSVAWWGERFADLVNVPPLIHRGQLHVQQWGAVPDSAKARKQLGWKPHTLRDGIRNALQYIDIVEDRCPKQLR